ncbi:Type II secretion system F domain protein [Desulfofundulus kuznetsovii DSM 6115]|uniref:Type II secretion system F domain protein n=1 Tax=Desulfofundulus kuznetsovii (strain DSM 6115 / VKM B-1805 / 17) TaxID=760568 RepID=A0AAU8PJR5_DESK7|nr:Type II secretion system F domain protein [Desulfofundulus kuznetsovii DSM 6115]
MDLKVIALFTFLAVALLVPGLQQLILARKKFITDRLKELAGQGGPDGSGRMEKINQDLRHNFFKSLLAHAGRLSPRVLSMAADRRLAEADLPFKGEEFVALAAFCAAGGGVIAVALTGRPELAVMAALAAGAAPFWLVKAIARRRVMLFNGQIADTLLIMANSLRAGFSFMQAIEVVQREMPPPIGREFGRTFRELSLGTPVEEALTSLVKRVKSEDLSLVVTAVLIQRQVGGNLAEVLDKIARTIQERVRIQGEIRALTAQGRLSGTIISVLPVFLVVVMLLINPGYISVLFTHPTGRMMLGAAVLAELLGWILIKRIVRISV